MIYSLFIAAAAFSPMAPLDTRALGASSARANTLVMQRKGGFWDREDWKAASKAAAAASASAAPVAAAAPAAAAVGDMSVSQACVFLANPAIASTSFADKKAFLEGKGVSAFVIAEAACTAPDTTLVL